MRRLNCHRVIHSARNVLQAAGLETPTWRRIHPKRRAYVWGGRRETRGVSETADSGIISSYLERASRRQASFNSRHFSFCLIRSAAYQLRDNYSDSIRAYLTLIGCPRVAKIFKQPLELIPRARITECIETINITMMGWDNREGCVTTQKISCL